MGVLQKDAFLFQRDEKANLIPQKVLLLIDENDPAQESLKGGEIMIIPLKRGEVRRMFSDLEKNKISNEQVSESDKEKDLDAQLVINNCFEPKFTKEDIPFMKPLIAAVVRTIFHHSGIDVQNKTKREAIEQKEDSFAKNYAELNQKEKKEI